MVNVSETVQKGSFEIIDTEAKAYFLGLVASAGIFKKDTVVVEYTSNEFPVLFKLAQELELPSNSIKNHAHKRTVSLTVSGKENIAHIRLHLSNEKSRFGCDCKMPTLDSTLVRHFVRGFFELQGAIEGTNQPFAVVSVDCPAQNSQRMIEELKGIIPFPSVSCETRFDKYLTISGISCLDFLGWMYENSELCMSEKYLKWHRIQSLDCMISPQMETFEWSTTLPDVPAPFKARSTDSGFDLCAMKLEKTNGNVYLYDTGIVVRPPHHVWFAVFARSSLHKLGYVIANSVGVIDVSYRGSIRVPLLKVDENAAEIPLGTRVAQIVPMVRIPIQAKQNNDINNNETSRGTGGFGSTGAK